MPETHSRLGYPVRNGTRHKTIKRCAMNHFKKITIGSMIIASLALSACAQEVPSDKNRVPASTSTAKTKVLEDNRDYTGADKPQNITVPKEATPADIPTDVPTAEPEVVKSITQQISDQPLGIDIDKALKDYSTPDVATIFPEAEFDVAAGVRFGLSTYQELVQTKNFYDPRDGTKDGELIAPFLDRFDDKMHKEITDSISEKGKTNLIPTSLPSGVFAHDDETATDIIPVDMPESTWGTPSVEIKYSESVGDYINVAGLRRISVTSTSGESYEAIVNYNVGVAPSGEDWLICAMGWKLVSLDKVTK